jgi:hypothetical protein
LSDGNWAQYVNEIEFCKKYETDLLANAVVKAIAPLMQNPF